MTILLWGGRGTWGPGRVYDLAAGRSSRSRLIDRARKGSGYGWGGQLSRRAHGKVVVVTPSRVPLNMSDIQQDSSEPSAPIMIKLLP